MERIRVGLIGANLAYSWGAMAHSPALLALPEYELAAVATAHAETARATAEHFGIPRAFHDYREMVQSPDIDMVVVSVRVPFHHEMTIAALNAGKHVFCEWPLGANSVQADEMASLAEAKGVHTMVGLQSRYAPSFQHLRNLALEGYLGRLMSANMTMFLPGLGRPRPEGAVWSTQREAGAHTLSIATGHALDVFLWCLGELTEVSAEVTTRMPQLSVADTDRTVDVTSPDNVSLLGRTVDGAVVSAHVASVPWHGTAFRMEAYGTEGTLVATSSQMVEMVDPALRGAKGSDQAMQMISPPDALRWAPPEVPEGVAVNMAQMFRRFAEAIRGDDVDAHPDFREAARRHHTLDALQRASDTGGRVVIDS